MLSHWITKNAVAYRRTHPAWWIQSQSVRTLTIAALISIPPYVHAHKLNLFAYVENNQVSVEGYFPDGKKARNSDVRVVDKQGNVLVTGVTDEQGVFLFAAPTLPAVRIIMNAGLGHLAEYDLAQDQSINAPLGNNNSTLTDTAQTPATPAQDRESANPIIQIQTTADIQRVVAHTIKPLAQEIAQLRQRTTLADIIGGIGFIIGILGSVAYWKAWKERQSSTRER